MTLRHGGGVTVKGGVNLRLFFDSERYSEDLDLDGTADRSPAIRSCLKGLFDDRTFSAQLRTFGLRGLDPGEGPNKDTHTTFRYKFGILAAGGVRYPTKVEVSFRGSHPADLSTLEAPSTRLLSAYGVERFEARHYARDAAVRQKVSALGGRREAQARDVFDIHVLLPSGANEPLLALLAKAVPRHRVKDAHARALTISYSEYRGQVLEFLGEDARSRLSTESVWDEVRLRVAAMLEGVLGRQGAG